MPIILAPFTWLRFSEQIYGKCCHLAAALYFFESRRYVYASQIHLNQIKKHHNWIQGADIIVTFDDMKVISAK